MKKEECTERKFFSFVFKKLEKLKFQDLHTGAKMPLPNDLKDKFIEIVEVNHVLTDPSLYGPYTDDFTDHYKSQPLVILRPNSTEQVSQIIKLCAENRLGVVVQGGNTNLTGSASTSTPDSEVLISLTRMKNLVSVDTKGDSMVVEAGMTLADVHKCAEDNGKFFPLSFAAEGNATIGGCLACNAGGVAVLRYGTTRELVLGIEVVLPDGRIWNGLRSLRKDNTGYDLKNLFMGSEGTLGVITKVVLKLFPIPKEKETSLVCVESPAKAVALLNRVKDSAGSLLTAFELISEKPISRVKKNLPDVEVPELSPSPWKVLLELSLFEKKEESVLESILEQAFEAEEITDAIIANSLKDSHKFWHVRESIPLADRTEGGSIHSDISLPIASIPEFLEVSLKRLKEEFPWIEDSIFGHLGDGNLHYNFVSPEDPTLTYRFEEEIRRNLYTTVIEYNGSISAEHGIGMLKKHHNDEFKDPIELELMKKIKNAIDPEGIMNPGKLI